MNQSLKDFMADNRRDFDDELPGLHNWSAVEKRLSQPAKKEKPISIQMGCFHCTVVLFGSRNVHAIAEETG
ncbi:MAG: hypothetical protein NVV59_01045 [Chitinophagaceae bacterium]|nr:hypothetical protein [Chitinophagaceae bacterium]